MPTTANPVYIRLTIIPYTCPTLILFDRVSIWPALNWGVLASSRDSIGLGISQGSAKYDPTSKVSGISNLPSAMRSAYTSVYSPTITDSVGGGAVTQGQANSAFSTVVEASATKGQVTVSGITGYIAGDDSTTIDFSSSDTTITDANNYRQVVNCTLNHSTNIMTINRTLIRSTVNLQGYSPATALGCTINNHPDVGIYVWDNVLNATTSGQVTVYGNYIYPNVHVTDGYAIYILGSNARAINNTIDSITSGVNWGLGISIDQGGQNNIEVGGNNVKVRLSPNREYGDYGTPARPISLRAWPQYGVFKNINIHDNTFEAITGVGMQRGAVGLRLTEVGPDNSNNQPDDIVFTNNLFKAICVGVADPGSTYYAYGMEVDYTVTSLAPLLFNQCSWETNGTAIMLYAAEAPKRANPGSHFHRSADRADFRPDSLPPYIRLVQLRRPWRYRQSGRRSVFQSDVFRRRDERDHLGSTSHIGINFGFTLTVTVKNGSGVVISGAAVSVTGASSMSPP